MKYNQYKNFGVGLLAGVLAIGAVSCEDQPDKFELTSGKPVVKYIRVSDPEKADSLLTGAYMDNLICLVGDNLTSIREMYFNDKKAVLNISYITDHTLLVNVPGAIPEVVTNKIYMVTADNDTVDYDFNVLVPGPSVRAMKCEWAKPGSIATLIGDYFIDDPNVPLSISFAGNVPVTEITDIQKTRVSFVVPENATPGYMNVTTIYGTGRSAFQFQDSRNMLFDWDGTRGGHALGLGWRDGSKLLRAPGDDEWEAIDGNYIRMGNDALDGEIGATWAEDAYCFNYWPDPANGYEELSSRPEFAEYLETYGLENLQMKFECLVPSSAPWSSCAMQLMFTGNDHVTYNTGTNAYYSDTSMARGLWNPWQTTGSYDTGNEWVTVSVPLSNFIYTHEGGAAGSPVSKGDMTGLTFFVWHGGVAGTTCSPYICIDNIRVVPIE